MEDARARSPLAWIIGSLVAALIFTLIAVAHLSRYGVQVNDQGTGLDVYVKYQVDSEIKTGYLVLDSVRKNGTLYKYCLYEEPSRKAGFFEVWSNTKQPFLSHLGGTIIGPKVRLDLHSKKVDMFKGEVWYIKQNLGPAHLNKKP